MPDHQALSRHIFIALIAGLVAGIAVYFLQQTLPAGGTAFIDTWLLDGIARVGGAGFVALLKMLVVPLVFVSLVAGMAGTGEDLARMGRIGVRALVIFLFSTASALVIAVSLALLTQPGAGVVLAHEPFAAPAAPSPVDALLDMFPANPVQAMASGHMLQLIIFALFVGVALARAGERATQVRQFVEQANTVVLELVWLVMRLAPIGVFCLVFRTFGERGPDIFSSVALYVLTVMAALVLHAGIVYSFFIGALARLNIVQFWRRMREPLLVAFATASSAATLPVNLRNTEQNLGVDRRVSSFVVPLGATVNMDGTAIMQGVATVFIAQAYGVDLSGADLALLVVMATLASIGTAPVPSVGLVTLAMVLTQLGLPVEAIGLILGVDRLLDMLRTMLNVAGDGVIAAAVARPEGLIDDRVWSRDRPAA